MSLVATDVPDEQLARLGRKDSNTSHMMARGPALVQHKAAEAVYQLVLEPPPWDVPTVATKRPDDAWRAPVLDSDADAVAVNAPEESAPFAAALLGKVNFKAQPFDVWARVCGERDFCLADVFKCRIKRAIECDGSGNLPAQ